MNKQRRKDIEAALDLIQQGLVKLRDAATEEQEYFDNMPENMQQGDKGTAAEQAAENLSEAADEIENAVSTAEAALCH